MAGANAREEVVTETQNVQYDLKLRCGRCQIPIREALGTGYYNSICDCVFHSTCYRKNVDKPCLTCRGLVAFARYTSSESAAALADAASTPGDLPGIDINVFDEVDLTESSIEMANLTPTVPSEENVAMGGLDGPFIEETKHHDPEDIPGLRPPPWWRGMFTSGHKYSRVSTEDDVPRVVPVAPVVPPRPIKPIVQLEEFDLPAVPTHVPGAYPKGKGEWLGWSADAIERARELNIEVLRNDHVIPRPPVAKPGFVATGQRKSQYDTGGLLIPIQRVLDGDNGSGGPGDDGFLLNNFGSRNLELRAPGRVYSLPRLHGIGEEQFQRLYQFYPSMYIGVFWTSTHWQVCLPAVVVEAGIAYASRLAHTRENFQLVQYHVMTLMYNVRMHVDEYRRVVELAPYVIWYYCDTELNHGLQRLIDGEYWDCRRVRQTFCKACCVLLLIGLALVGLGIGGYELYQYASTFDFDN